MSLPKKITIDCCKCGKSFPVTVFESVNTNYSKDLPEQIMTGELFRAQCPHCKFIAHLEYDFLYHDVRNAAMIWVVYKKSPEYASKISEIRAIHKIPYNTMRIVEDVNALKEKVSCLEKARDDRIIELCKAFVVYKLFSQQPDFAFRNAFYTAVSGKEVIYLYDIDGNSMCYDLSDDLYDYLKNLYNNSPHAERFDHNYPVVDYTWAEEILNPLIQGEVERIESGEGGMPCKAEADVALKSKSICPLCNSNIPDDSEFCQFCGTRILVTEDTPVIDSNLIVLPDLMESSEAIFHSLEQSNAEKTESNEEASSFEVGELATLKTEVTCPTCNSVLPMDSEFCQFCGSRILMAKGTISSKPEALVLPDPAESGEGFIENGVSDDAQEVIKRNDSDMPVPQKKAGRNSKLLIAVLVIAVVLSVAGNIGQFFVHSHSASNFESQLEEANKMLVEKDATIASYKEEISSQAATITSNKNKISSQETTINQQKRQISDLKVKKEYFDEIVSEMRYGNAGYAASNFCASDSVIVVDKNDTSCKFTLTANWSYGGTVSVDYSSSAAWVSFDNNTWSKSTTMTVHPLWEGITVVTFSNDVDSKTFKVLIIVTD